MTKKLALAEKKIRAQARRNGETVRQYKAEEEAYHKRIIALLEAERLQS